MVKRLVVLVGMLAVMLAAAVPALAQGGFGPAETITATGVIKDLGRHCNECAHHGMTDEASGTVYELLSDPSNPNGGVDLRDYVGERVTIHGTPQTQSTGRSDILFVTQVEPADSSAGSITATFELAVEGEPPAGTVFFGVVGQQPVRLTDPDGDGTYAGSLTLPADFGTFPIPVAIIAGDPADPQQTIKSFGKVMLEDGNNFSASVSFEDGGSSNNGSETKATPKTEAKAGDAEAKTAPKAEAKVGGTEAKAGVKELPNTGGAALIILGAGALLVAGGLLVRRANH